MIFHKDTGLFRLTAPAQRAGPPVFATKVHFFMRHGPVTAPATGFINSRDRRPKRKIHSNSDVWMFRDWRGNRAKFAFMNPDKWLPKLPLFGTRVCVYCGGAADTSDHTPPKCLLPRKLPTNTQLMTVPACSSCNNGYSKEEIYAAAIICTVGFTTEDRTAVAAGGWIHSAMQRDKKLRMFIDERLGADGIFQPDRQVLDIVYRIMKKTATGLLFFEFGRIVRPNDLTSIAINHAKNIHPSALVESHRRPDSGYAEVTPSGRELERQVMALAGLEPKHMPKWKVSIPEYFEYMFIKRTNRMLMCAMKVHDALTVLLECPWPSTAGPRRRGEPRRRV